MSLDKSHLSSSLQKYLQSTEVRQYGTIFPDTTVERILRYAAPLGSLIEVHDKLPRCMGRLKEMVATAQKDNEPLPSGTVIIARQLSQGCGRFDREWYAPSGGFWIAGSHKLALVAVVVFLVLNWFGDSLDGTLARYRNQQRPKYGYYVDHVIDLIGTTALLGGLALSGYMSPLIALGMLGAFLLVEAEVYLATHVRQVFKLGMFGFGPTELRVLLAAGALYLLHNPWVHIGGYGPFLLFDVGGVVAIVGMVIVMLYSAVRNTRALYKAEPIRP